MAMAPQPAPQPQQQQPQVQPPPPAAQPPPAPQLPPQQQPQQRKDKDGEKVKEKEKAHKGKGEPLPVPKKEKGEAPTVAAATLSAPLPAMEYAVDPAQLQALQAALTSDPTALLTSQFLPYFVPGFSPYYAPQIPGALQSGYLQPMYGMEGLFPYSPALSQALMGLSPGSLLQHVVLLEQPPTQTPLVTGERAASGRPGLPRGERVTCPPELLHPSPPTPGCGWRDRVHSHSQGRGSQSVRHTFWLISQEQAASPLTCLPFGCSGCDGAQSWPCWAADSYQQ